MPAIYQVNQIGEVYGQGTLNRYFYLASGVVEEASIVNAMFVDVVVPAILNLLSQDYTLHRIDCVNVLNPGDYASAHGPVQGVRSGDTKPAHDTYGVKLVPSSGLFRKGGKRYSGVSEDMTVDGGANSGAVPYLNALSAALLTFLDIDASTYIRPGLARPQSPTSWLFSQIIAAPFNFLSTQNSRKVYSGGGPITAFNGIIDGIVNFTLSGEPSGDPGFDSSEDFALGDLELEGVDLSSYGGSKEVPSGISSGITGVVDDEGNLT